MELKTKDIERLKKMLDCNPVYHVSEDIKEVNHLLNYEKQIYDYVLKQEFCTQKTILQVFAHVGKWIIIAILEKLMKENFIIKNDD